MPAATTVWGDLREVETRHTRLIHSGVTLCGVGSEHTRNFSRHPRLDSRCGHCQARLDKLNAAHYFYPKPS